MKPEKQIYQWDVNQYLTELQPTAEFVDYPIGNEVIRIKSDGTRCRIPDEVLQTYGGKTCYERYPDGTFRAYSFSVLYAPKPPDYVFTPEERTTFEALTDRVDAAIDEIKRLADSGEFTPKKGVDYFTDAEKAEMMESVSSGAVGEFRKVVDSATADFNENSSVKTNDYNTNAADKMGEYDNNAADKLKAYNDNHTEKMTAYDTNATDKLSTYNTNAGQKLESYNSNHTEKLTEYNANAETKTAEFDSNAAALQTEVDRLRGECDQLAEENRKQENRIDALIKLNKGQTYDILPEEGEAASRTAPSGAKYVSVDKVGGKSVVWNQLISLTDVNDIEINGITFTVNKGDGTIIANGTATKTARLIFNNVNYKMNHKYLMMGCPKGGSANSYFLYGDCGQSILDSGDGVIKVALIDNIHRAFIHIESGVTLDNIVFIPQLFDLTQIFGAGNEPSTVEEFEAMFPADYYPYSEPTIISSQTDRVEVASADSTVTQQITTGFPALNSAGSVYDYIDLNEGKLHQRVGVKDLGTLNWGYQASGTSIVAPYMYTDVKYLGIKYLGVFSATVHNIICPKYTTVARNPTAFVDKTICADGDANNAVTQIQIKDSAYTDATAFKESMNGVMLYYELAEPIITDITIPTELTDWLEVEAGGSVTFHNSDESKQLAVPNAVSWVRKLNEVN